MKKEHSESNYLSDDAIKVKWIVVDNLTRKVLYGLYGKTLTFNSEDEADNFGRQICKTYFTMEIKF